MDFPNHKLTVRSEKYRSAFFGPFIALNYAQFLLYVALEYFHAPEWGKSLIAASTGMGMLLNPLIMETLKRLRFPVSKAIAYTVFTAAVCLLPAALYRDFSVYLPCVVIGVCLLGSLPTLITAMWRNNVAPEFRGQHFSQVCLLGSISALACGVIMALLLRKTEYTQYYYLVLAGVCISLVIAGAFVWRIPGKPPQTPNAIPFSNLRLLWQDPLFAYICFAWFFLGLGNLATIPLRVEYMASGNYGHKYSVAMVLFIMQIVPQGLRLGSTLVWGKIFDRMNLMHVRLMINFFFFTSIVFFFFPPLYCQVIGAACFGLASGGGEVIWNLWVTKIAPPEKTSDYMSVHVFLCGIRAIGGPMLAYYLLNSLSLHEVVYSAAGLVLFSSLMFIPLLRHPRMHLKS